MGPAPNGDDHAAPRDVAPDAAGVQVHRLAADVGMQEGCDEADVVWDLASGMRVPFANSSRRAAMAKRTARPKTQARATPKKKAA